MKKFIHPFAITFFLFAIILIPSFKTANGQTNALPIVTLTANPTSIDLAKTSSSGPQTTLSWSSTNATSCTASDKENYYPIDWHGSVATSGEKLVGSFHNFRGGVYTFVITCSNADGQQASAEAVVTITDSNTLLCLLPGATNYNKELPCVFPPDPQPFSSSAGKIQFIKRLLNIKSTYEFPQSINDIIFANNQFIFGGDCLVNMASTDRGGGIWIVSEDGSANIIERSSCNDAGKVKHLLSSFHGQVTDGPLHVNWSGNGFVKENTGFGPFKANRSVNYSPSGAPISSSPLDLYNYKIVVLKNRLLAFETPDYKIVSLPDWNVTGAIPYDGGGYLAFGDFIFRNNNGTLYSVSNAGALQEIQKLGSGYTGENKIERSYSYDNSTSPAKFAILEVNITKPGPVESKKIYVYNLLSNGVSLDKTINLPTNFPTMIYGENAFGIWGNYVVTRSNTTQGELQLWNNGQKIDTIKIPNNATFPQKIVISKKGYIATSVHSTDEGTTAAYLFKIAGVSPVGEVSIDDGCVVGNKFSTTTGTPCACVLNQKFSLWSRGEDVKVHQLTLRDAGFYLGKIDGIFGPISAAASFGYCQSVENPIYVSTTKVITSVPPVISEVDGPRTLGINQQGTWTAKATDANLDDLSWSVNWGSGRSVQTCQINPPAGTSQNWSYTTAHSWTAGGTYTVTMYASDCKGNTAKNTFTVSVR